MQPILEARKRSLCWIHAKVSGLVYVWKVLAVLALKPCRPRKKELETHKEHSKPYVGWWSRTHGRRIWLKISSQATRQVTEPKSRQPAGETTQTSASWKFINQDIAQELLRKGSPGVVLESGTNNDNSSRKVKRKNGSLVTLLDARSSRSIINWRTDFV